MRCKEQTITFYPDIHSEKTMTEVFPETRLAFETSGSTAVATAAVNFAIEDGKSYIVEFDDVLHEIVAASGALTNDLFRVTVADGVMTVSIAQAGSHTVRVITCTTHVCKLPEEYLPEGSGGGGGASVLGDDGKIKKEHLPEGYPYVTRQEGYVLEECQPFYDEESGVFAGTTSFSVLENGLNCTVNVNGTDYECVMSEYLEDGVLFGYALGNLGAMAGDESLMTDEPFVVLAYTPETAAAQGFAFMVAMLDGSTSLTLSVKADVPTYEKLRNDYLDLDWIPKLKGYSGDLGFVSLSIADGEQLAITENIDTSTQINLIRSNEVVLSADNETYNNLVLKRRGLNNAGDLECCFGNAFILDPSYPNTGEPLVLTYGRHGKAFQFSAMLAEPSEGDTAFSVHPKPNTNPLPSFMLPIQHRVYLTSGGRADDYVSIWWANNMYGSGNGLVVYDSFTKKAYKIPLEELTY